MRGAGAIVLALLLAGCTLEAAPPDAEHAPSATPTEPGEQAPPPPTPSGSGAPPTSPGPSVPTAPAPPSAGPTAPTSSAPAGEPTAPPPSEPTPAPPSASPATPTTPAPVRGGGDPIRFLLEPGADPAGGPYFRSWTRSTDGRGFQAELRAVQGATLRIDSLARLTASFQDLPVRVNATPVSDPGVLDARIVVVAGGVEQATLDLRAADPQVELVLAQGVTYHLAWTWTLAQDATDGVNLTVSVGQR